MSDIPAVCLSVHLSLHPAHSAQNSLHGVNQSGRIVTQSALFLIYDTPRKKNALSVDSQAGKDESLNLEIEKEKRKNSSIIVKITSVCFNARKMNLHKIVKTQNRSDD